MLGAASVCRGGPVPLRPPRRALRENVGKIENPTILRKPGPLAAEEWEIIGTHATMGARILAGARSRVVQLAEEIALHLGTSSGTARAIPRVCRGNPIPLRRAAGDVADCRRAHVRPRVP